MRLLFLAVLLLSQTACMTGYIKSRGGEKRQVFTKVYLADPEMVWQACLEALKSYPLDVSNRETGLVQTRWKDNTALRNLADSFGGEQVYLNARFRYRVRNSEGAYDGKPSVRVMVEKEQMVQEDVLERWRAVPSDSIEEQTLLYRIGRIVKVRMMLAQLEEERRQKALGESEAPVAAPPQKLDREELQVPPDPDIEFDEEGFEEE